MAAFDTILIIALVVGLFCSVEGIFNNEDNSSE